MSDYISASEFINRALLVYGKSMVHASIPNMIDGLKPVHRRILVSVREIKDEFKSLRLIANTLETHPYGDNSIYHAAARIGQTFEYNPPLLTFEGSCGTYSEPRPADARYTSECVSEFTKDVFFKGIEFKALPKKTDEGLDGYEPVHLIPSIPIALVYANNSIGYGKSSYTIPHSLSDVCDLVVAFCQHQKLQPLKPFNYVEHVEKFIPEFPIDGILTNYDDLIVAYRGGNFEKRICLDGTVTLTVDEIHIRTLPYGVPFSSLNLKIEDLMRDKGSWFDQHIQSVKSLKEEHAVAGEQAKAGAEQGEQMARYRSQRRGRQREYPAAHSGSHLDGDRGRR